MVRRLLGVLVLSFVLIGFTVAQEEKEKKKGKKGRPVRATITKVDPDANPPTITVEFKGKEGKKETKEFKLTRSARLINEDGEFAAINVFRAGDSVLVVEAAGELVEVRKVGKDGEKKKRKKKDKDDN